MITNPLETQWQRKWLRMESVHPCIQSVANEVQDFCGRWCRNNRAKSLLVLVGKSGTGKTHIAKAVIRFATAMAQLVYRTGAWGSKEVPNCFFISWPVAVSQFGEKQFGLADDASHHSLVVLDDIGAENDPWGLGRDRLCQILNARENLFTVITTNILPECWDEKFSTRISDRLLRNSVVKILTCESFTLQRQPQEHL